MGAACRITRELVALRPVNRDVFPKYEAVQAWALVSPLYQGIEQALKMLLLTPSDTRFTLRNPKDLPEGTDLKDLKNKPYGHNLKRLYAELDADDRAHIERHFQEHWSLYQYDTRGANITTAEQFIAQINGISQTGSVAWRYFLLDETIEIPTVSLGTMSEIWDAICCRIRRDVFDKQDDCSRLSRMLAFDFGRLVLDTIPVPYDEFTDEVNEWIVHRDGDQLAAWIDLFVKTSHNALHEVQAPDRLRPELAKMANRALKKMASDSADPDQAMLLRRIQAEPNFTWDPVDGTFR